MRQINMFKGIENNGVKIDPSPNDYAIIDIETIINKDFFIDNLNYKYNTQIVNYSEALKIYEEKEKTDFPPLAFHVPVLFSILYCDKDFNKLNITSYITDPDNENELIKDFWRFAETFPGRVVTFNGRGYDFPVMEYHAIRLGLPIIKYMEDSKISFRHRYGRHIDLMDLMSNYGAVRRFGGLDAICQGLGLPGKSLNCGVCVQSLYDNKEFNKIQDYCENDVSITYALLVKYAVTMGKISPVKANELLKRS